MRNKIIPLLLLALITLLGLFLRIYRVADTPHDLYVDEVAIGWNAYSILKTGRDEYGTFMPLSFKSFGDYKLPVYIYLTTLSEAVFGKNAFAVRFPSVILGSFTIVVFAALIQLLTRSAKYALLGALLLAISPWHLQFTRAAFEASVARFFSVLGVYLLLLFALRKRKTFFWGIGFLVISLYTYHFSRVIAPLLTTAVCFLYWPQVRNLYRNTSSYIKTLVLILLTIPFIIYAFSAAGLSRARSESFMRDLPVSFQNDFVKATNWEIDRWEKNYLSYFSLDFLFFAGDTIGRHSVREMGMTYLWQLPFFLIGIAYAFKNRSKSNLLLLFWLLVSPIAAAFATPNPQALRGLPGVVTLTYFTTLGLKQSFAWFNSYLPIYKTVLVVCIAYGLLDYLHIYYYHYAKRTAPDWNGGYKEALDFILPRARDFEHIALTNSLIKGYAFLFFYGDFDPKLTQRLPHQEAGYGKFTFIPSPFIAPPNSLYLAKPEDPAIGRRIATIKDKANDIQYYVWEN